MSKSGGGASAKKTLLVTVAAVAAATSFLPVAWCEYYQVVDPNVREGCTPRCKDTSSYGQWRCSDVKTASGSYQSVCNTFELEDPHQCHFHTYSQKEIGQCMSSEDVDIYLMGSSNNFGMMSSVFSYFNRADASYWNPYDWLDDDTNDNHRVFGCYTGVEQAQLTAAQIHVDANGYIKWKGGITNGGRLYDMLDLAMEKDTTTSGGYITHFRTGTEDNLLTALDAIKYQGRQYRRGYLAINSGHYFASDSLFRSAMVKVIERVRNEFPHFTIVLVGYATTVGISINDVMRELVSTYSAKKGYTPAYPPIMYLNVYGMVNVPNAPKLAAAHWVHVMNLQIFQRVLSVACADAPYMGDECEEQTIGSSNCQWREGFETYESQWWRQCNLLTYTDNSAPFPNPPSVAGMSPEARAPLRCSDHDGDGYSTCAGDCNDYDANIHPCGWEACDRKDNNCNGQVDESCSTPIVAPAPGPSNLQASCSNKPLAWCGGALFKGNSCCPTGYYCKKQSYWWSDCQKQTGACSNTFLSKCGGKDFKGSTCCSSGTYCKYQNQYYSDCQQETCSNKPEGRCGGQLWRGSTCCPFGYYCKRHDQWWSDCQLNGS